MKKGTGHSIPCFHAFREPGPLGRDPVHGIVIEEARAACLALEVPQPDTPLLSPRKRGEGTDCPAQARRLGETGRRHGLKSLISSP
jgi:hypothetical protein